MRCFRASITVQYFREPGCQIWCFRAAAMVLQGASYVAVLQGASYKAVLQGARLQAMERERERERQREREIEREREIYKRPGFVLMALHLVGW